MSESHLILNNLKDVLNYQRFCRLFKRNLIALEKIRLTFELNKEFELEEKKLENNLLVKIKEEQEKDLNIKKTIIFLVCTGLALMLMLSFFLYQSNLTKEKAKKQKKKRKESNNMMRSRRNLVN